MPKAAKPFQHYARRVEAGEDFELAPGETLEEFQANGLVEGGPEQSGPTTTENGSVPEGNLPPPNPVGSVPNEGTTPGADPVVVAKEGDKPEGE
jgi:hypothetical protein